MSSSDPSEDDPPTSLDDPDWVDRIVARAMESAEKGTTSADDNAPKAAAGEKPKPARRPAPGPNPASAPPAARREPPRDARPSPVPPAARQAAARQPRPRPAPEQPAARAPRTQPDPGGDPGAGPRTRPAEPVSTAPREPQRPDSEPSRAVPAAAATTVTSTVFDQEDDLDLPLPIEPDDTDERKSADRNRALVEWIAVIAGAIAVAFLVKTFLLQAFYIPSSSMEPTLQVNDRVLVNKLSYDFNDVSRGDLVVFERPENLVTDTNDLIKRVIGLPGETLELIDGRVYIDGRGLNEPYVGEQSTNWLGFDETARELCGGDDLCTIPEGYVFVMGDNRAGSTDSRRFGPIPDDNVVGRAFLRIWPLNDISWL